MEIRQSDKYLTIDNQLEETENFLPLRYEWTWDEELSTSQSIKLSNNNLKVTFHPVYSTGTAVVKGNKSFEKGRHHFWEILMTTHMYGTDVMVGVGTANAVLNNAGEDFCSLLGRDKESWGFSYRGYLQHDGKTRKYGTIFDRDNLVGIHLDTWTGTLQFFIDREPLGVAFTKLNDVTLYPLVSSTMAQCVMKLTYSCSVPVSLQTTCLALLSDSQKMYLAKKFPCLHYLTRSIFVDILQKPIDCDNEDDMDQFPADYIVLNDFAFKGLPISL